MSVVTKTRVLFVDDEPLVLQGLQRMLRRLTNEWEMAFVTSGPAALKEMESAPYNVVISDMRMPGMSGADLLSQVAKTYPKTVRLILSGHADKNLIVQCVGSAHQFLAKPCEPDDLKSAVRRAQRFEDSVQCDILKELIAKMETLPSVPTLFHQIMRKIQDENCSLDDIAELIASDLAMTAKLLKVVNSAFFGLKRQVNNPVEAVSFLGLDTIKALVLAVNAFCCFDEKDAGPLSLENLWSHSLEVANWSRAIARHENASQTHIDESFISGMLHDIGKLALSSNLPARYREAVELARREKLSIYTAEEKIFGANHADVGGYLLSLWGLPARVVDAISFHHQPSSSVIEGYMPLAVVHAADVLSNETEATPIGQRLTVDESYFTSHNLTEKLPVWRTLKP
jgi:putative nucleotidyltransferase with HDIG domain